MADITLTIQRITESGVIITHLGSLSLSNTYKLRNDGRSFIRVVNGGGLALNVTIGTPGSLDGNAVADRIIIIGAGTEKNIGPFPPSIYNDGDGDVDITFDKVGSVTIATMNLG